MFSKILVPLDATKTSLRALKPARAIADATGAELIVATVVFAEVIDRSEREAELLRRSVEAGITPDRAEVRVSSVSVAEGLHDLMGADSIVVIASPGHPHTTKPFGNVSEEIVHHRLEGFSIIVGPKVDVNNYRLSGPVFGCLDPTGPEDDLIDAVAKISTALKLAPWLVSVADRTEVPVVAGGLPAYDRSFETNQLRSLARRLEELGTPTANYEVLHSPHAAAEIVRFADSADASLLVVATRDRDGLSRLLFGSVAMSIVKKATAPVLAVHRDRMRRK